MRAAAKPINKTHARIESFDADQGPHVHLLNPLECTLATRTPHTARRRHPQPSAAGARTPLEPVATPPHLTCTATRSRLRCPSHAHAAPLPSSTQRLATAQGRLATA